MEVTSVLDADTIKVTEDGGSTQKVRSSAFDTYESVHKDSSKNTQRGKDQSTLAKSLLQSGDEVELVDEGGKGVFGRQLANYTKDFNGKSVNMNYMFATLGAGNYHTKFGKGVTEDAHKNYSMLSNDYLPYQIGDVAEQEPMSEKEYQQTYSKFNELQQVMEQGVNMKRRDELIESLYGDGNTVVGRMLNIQKTAKLKMDWDNQPMSSDKVIYEAFQDPQMQKNYNEATLSMQGADVGVGLKQKHITRGDRIDAMVSRYWDVAQLTDVMELYDADQLHMKDADKILAHNLQALPPQLHGDVYDDARKNGNEHAVVYARQLEEDLKNEDIFNNMSMTANFGYTIGGFLMSPTTYVGGAVGGSAYKVAGAMTKGWTSKVGSMNSFATKWAGVGFAEGTIANLPRLSADHTYTPRDYALDVALDTGLGMALPAVGKSVLYGLQKTGVRGTKLIDGVEDAYLRGEGVDGALDPVDIHIENYAEEIQKAERGAQLRVEEDLRVAQKPIESTTMSQSKPLIIETPWLQKAKDVTKKAVTGEAPPTEAEVLEGVGDVLSDDISTSIQMGDVGSTGDELFVQPLQQTNHVAGAIKDQQQQAMVDIKKFAEKNDKSWRKMRQDVSGTLSAVGSLVGKTITHRLKDSNNILARMVGNTFLEDSMGMGGKHVRRETAASIKGHSNDLLMTQLMGPYADSVDLWAKSKGAGSFGRMSAARSAGLENKLADGFHREVLQYMNNRKLGRSNANVHPEVAKFAKSWDEFLETSHKIADDAGMNNWGKVSKAHGVPQALNPQKFLDVESRLGKQKTEALIGRAVRGAMDTGQGALLTSQEINTLTKNITKIMRKADGDASELARVGQFLRQNALDWDAEIDGVKMLDLMDTDLVEISQRLSGDLSGRAGLSRMTGGRVVSDGDIRKFLGEVQQEYTRLERLTGERGTAQDVATLQKANAKEFSDIKDEFANLLGRPSRGGLMQEARHLKTFTTLTRMGVLGTSQAIETGNVIARSVVNLFSDPQVLKRIYALSGHKVDDPELARDMIQIFGRDIAGVEHTFRNTAVTDETSRKALSNGRKFSVWMADKATGGSLKSPATRLLTKTSGFNFMMRNQEEFAQKEFIVLSDKFFNGKGGISDARMRDLGLSGDPKIQAELENIFKTVVGRDEHGFIKSLNIKEWSKEALSAYSYAAYRNGAQKIQATLVGEKASIANNPWMNLLAQFREVPLVAQNKQLARNLAFADSETAMAIVLNVALAGMIKYSWNNVLGYGKHAASQEDGDYRIKGLQMVDVGKYLAAGGMFPDAIDMGMSAHRARTRDNPNEILRQVPMYGQLKSYYDVVGAEDHVSRVEAMKGVTLNGNTWWMDLIHSTLVGWIKNLDPNMEVEEPQYRY